MNTFFMARKSLLVFALVLLIIAQGRTQENHTISGYIRDAATGENLIGANVQIPELQEGTVTNNYGFYSLTVPEGSYSIRYSYLGYQEIKKEVQLDEAQRINVELEPSAIETEEVEVEGEREDANVTNTKIGTQELDIDKVEKMPALLGEVDILKSMQLLPGVQASGEGNSGFYVRGGGPSQNLILLDEAPVYNTGHLFGFFSVFNSDAIKSTELIKGGMPAEYGGRLSSVVDISMKDGNMKEYHAEGGIGLISSKLTVEGPIVEDKASFMISGRRTYIDVLTRPFTKGTDFEGNQYYFYDLNAKINYKFSDQDRLYLSGYFGRDVFQFKSGSSDFNTKIPWGNATATLRWNHLFSDQLFMNVSAIYNDYNFELGVNQENWDFKLFSGIRDYNLKADFSYFPHPDHDIKFGLDYTYHTFIPNSTSGESADGTNITSDSITEQYGHEAAVYLQDKFDVTDRIKINAGLRFSFFQQVGPYNFYGKDDQKDNPESFEDGEPVTNYSALEPRLNVRYQLTPSSSIKASYTRTEQYLHLVSNSTTTLPTDVWVPSTKKVKPELARQYSLGYFRNFNDNMFETSIEVYYKKLRNQIEYDDGYTPELGRPIERDFVFGTGESFGVELYLKKRVGRLTGWIGYTLSKTTRFFDDLDTEVFPAKYDRRHDLSVTGVYDLSERWSLSSTFVYGTGQATTIPERWYVLGGNLNNVYGDRNSFRLEPYHRLDISATLGPKEKNQKFQSSWVFSIYNVYNHKNPFFIYFDQQGDLFKGNLDVQAKKVALFPILPAVTWKFKF